MTAFLTLAPITPAIAIANTMPGNETIRSAIRIITASAHPPKLPATTPSAVPSAKIIRTTEKAAAKSEVPESDLDLDKLMAELSDDEVVRRKQIEYSPKTEDEALTDIDLLGHDFYVYTDRDSGEVHVLYRRHGGGYGLLTTAR